MKKLDYIDNFDTMDTDQGKPKWHFFCDATGGSHRMSFKDTAQCTFTCSAAQRSRGAMRMIDGTKWIEKKLYTPE